MANPRIEELPDDFDQKLSVSDQKIASSQHNGTIPSLEDLISKAQSHGSQPNGAPKTAGAQMHPDMAEVKESTAEEVLELMNRMPLFMTNMDNIGGPDGEENIQLEALRALAYEGTRAEIAANFREQGNEAAREKRWKDAREFYDRALETLRMTDDQLLEIKGGEGPSDFEIVELDNEDEQIKEKQILEASLVNRALCNLEMSTATPFLPTSDTAEAFLFLWLICIQKTMDHVRGTVHPL